jgi:hypothetical protein
LEQGTAANDIASSVLDAFVLDIRAHGLEHLLAELGIHGSPVGFISGLLESELNHLAQSAAISLVLGLRSDNKNLVGDSFKVLRCHLVESSLDLPLDHLRVHVATGCSGSAAATLAYARWLPTTGTNGDWLDLYASSKRHGLSSLCLLGTLVTSAAGSATARLAG